MDASGQAGTRLRQRRRWYEESGNSLFLFLNSFNACDDRYSILIV
jgi:hypothetical protein